MARAFAKIAFTPSVKAAQTRYGSRATYAGLDAAGDTHDVITPREATFIEARDGFYQASVGEGGWPYVQFRGGPRGFLKVLGERTIGYADFRGNVQYISVGNIAADGRVALILMDYANRRRLKIWGRARIVHEDEDPGLVARLENPAYRARVERAVVITVEAFDWNCPQHIVPRFTEDEIAALTAPLQRQIEQLSAENRRLASAGTAEAIGNGPLSLVVSAIRQLTPKVRLYELRSPSGEALPPWTAGAHLHVPVCLADGREQTRSYSLAGDPAERRHYEIAVRLDEDGRGGSAALHRDIGLGTVLRCGLPANRFPLHTDERPAILIAGGIGITPFRAMALALSAGNRPFTLHYVAPTASDMAFHDDLAARIGARLRPYTSRGDKPAPLDVRQVLATMPADAVVYVCGPARLIDAVRQAAAALGIAPERLHFERFTAGEPAADDGPTTVDLARSGRTVAVRAEETILDAVIAAGVDAPSECRAGTCGTCAVKVIAGTPDHRDSVLTPDERDRAGLMCICVSRAATERLVLDL
ncbi:hypothetical protein GGR16_003675 [Chelatococcus caeni]|uniref:Pyridoxamine 5'-phosphate oxidase n=1 Tax=Chelatococcus caeni TaxID=1348468 RepID=A0A840C4U1_9HYPH|nr:hypothetical protein [Chelatococcus caeni]